MGKEYQLCLITENKWFKSYTNDELSDETFIELLKRCKKLFIVAQYIDDNSVALYGSPNGKGLYNLFSKTNNFINYCNDIEFKTINDSVLGYAINEKQDISKFVNALDKFIETLGINDLKIEIIYYEDKLTSMFNF